MESIEYSTAGQLHQFVARLAASNDVSRGTVQTFEFGVLGRIDVPRVDAGRSAEATRSAWGSAAETFVRGYATRRGATGREAFKSRRVIQDKVGQVHVRVAQTMAGLSVVGAELIVHADAKSGKVLGVNGRFAPDYDLPRRAEVNANAAIENAAGEYGIAANVVGVPELTYIMTEEGDDAVRLAWTNLVSYQNEEGEQLDRIFADALTGAAIARHPQIHRAKNRQTYTCNNGTSLPGTLLFSEGGSSADTTAMAAYNNVGTTYDYYSATHGRDSWNNAGGTLTSSVHYGVNYNNAHWGSNQLYYGDGDGSLFGPFPLCLDVVAHEMTHGVVQSTAGLIYSNESGALNESAADVFGAATESSSDGSVNTDTWKVGEDCFTPGTAGDAMRYMNDPVADGASRDYYPARYTGGADNGGVHWNSGISNLAFYLLVAGGGHPRGQTFFQVTSIGMSDAEQIYYRALDVYATSTTNFRLWRDYTRQAAEDLFGTNSTEHTAVWNAWAAVGNHWQTASTTISTSGGSYNGTSYSPSTANLHTGHLFGPAGSNFDLYLEKWNGSTWAVVASGTSGSTNEVVTYSGAAGTYRWRVQSVSGTGTFSLHWNHPR